MAVDETALRQKVDATQAKVDELRAKYHGNPSDATGRRLLKARQEASQALEELWAAFPQEKPQTQFVL